MTMLSALLLASTLHLHMSEGEIAPSIRLAFGPSGRIGLTRDPQFSAQGRVGIGFVLRAREGLAVAIWPEVGGGLDVSVGLLGGYTLGSVGFLLGNLRWAIGYRPGIIAGVDRMRDESPKGLLVDRRRGALGFHHGLEVRGPAGFWGFDLQHDVYVRPELRHGIRLLVTFEFPIGLLVGIVGDDVSFGPW